MQIIRYTDDLSGGFVVGLPWKIKEGPRKGRTHWSFWYGPERPWVTSGPLDYSVAVFKSRAAAEAAMRPYGQRNWRAMTLATARSLVTLDQPTVERAVRLEDIDPKTWARLTNGEGND